jgi:hypothetical protein
VQLLHKLTVKVGLAIEEVAELIIDDTSSIGSAAAAATNAAAIRKLRMVNGKR